MHPSIAQLRAMLLSASLAGLVTACAVNPVTGKNELHITKESQERQIGAQQYAPSRQSQGGDLITDPALTAYVQQVGARVAAHARRKLDYEFVVLASGVPNAWALPGGKVAVNRGLLLALDDEAELAAVLGHEVTHADARHGAEAMDRGLLAQVGMVALAVGVQGDDNSAAVMGAALLGTQLITTKYGRDAELEADKYGTLYMAEAGYDPHAAITLQEKFVALMKGQKQDWLQGLFATHPPSEERVIKNRKTVEQVLKKVGDKLVDGGEHGRDAYQKATAGIRRTKPAYDAYDEGRKLLAKGDAKAALAAAQKAIAIDPNEALFQGLAGQAQQKLGDTTAARKSYDTAVAKNPAYFEFWLRRGLMRQQAGDPGARADIEHAHSLLPTKTSAQALGLPTGG